jgi:ribulose-5-phosphate 4-epimerase/fuculose-1-phosphate aldolase
MEGFGYHGCLSNPKKRLIPVAGHDVREDLAQVCRVLAHHEMIDLWGHLSMRLPGGDRVAVSPRFGRSCLPRLITARDVLVCDASGKLIEGSGALPVQFETDLDVYRRNPERKACLFAAPRVAMAAAIAGYALKPLTHMESATGFGLETCTTHSSLGEMTAAATAVHQPGIGTWAAGKDLFDCLATLYHLEYLAQANLVVAGEPGVKGIAREDSDKLWRQFSGHHHYHEFFASLDPGPGPHPYESFLKGNLSRDDALEQLKCAMAYSCRALWERDTLVAFLEHISHRAPGGKHFLMTASKTFRDIGPKDVCLLDYQANLVDGPKPPGFKWFHAQLLTSMAGPTPSARASSSRATASAWTSPRAASPSMAAATSSWTKTSAARRWMPSAPGRWFTKSDTGRISSPTHWRRRPSMRSSARPSWRWITWRGSSAARGPSLQKPSNT